MVTSSELPVGRANVMRMYEGHGNSLEFTAPRKGMHWQRLARTRNQSGGLSWALTASIASSSISRVGCEDTSHMTRIATPHPSVFARRDTAALNGIVEICDPAERCIGLFEECGGQLPNSLPRSLARPALE